MTIETEITAILESEEAQDMDIGSQQWFVDTELATPILAAYVRSKLVNLGEEIKKTMPPAAGAPKISSNWMRQEIDDAVERMTGRRK